VQRLCQPSPRVREVTTVPATSPSILDS
jgi:hypothetical protein